MEVVWFFNNITDIEKAPRDWELNIQFPYVSTTCGNVIVIHDIVLNFLTLEHDHLARPSILLGMSIL